MAENESLDLAKSRRWAPVVHVVREGGTATEIAKKAHKAIVGSLRAAIKDFAKCGVSFEQFLDAAEEEGGAALQSLVKQCKGHDFARLLAEVARMGGTRDTIIEEFVLGVREKYLDQIGTRIVPCERWKRFSDLRSHLARVKEHDETDVHWIVEKFSNDPNWRPRQRPRSKGTVLQDNTAEMMGFSLMAVR
jgi:hypothetical protein